VTTIASIDVNGGCVAHDGRGLVRKSGRPFVRSSESSFTHDDIVVVHRFVHRRTRAAMRRASRDVFYDAWTTTTGDDDDDGDDDDVDGSDDDGEYVSAASEADETRANSYAYASSYWGQRPSEDAKRKRDARKLLARQLLGLEPESASLKGKDDAPASAPALDSARLFQSKAVEGDAEAEDEWRRRRNMREEIIDSARSERSSGAEEASDSDAAATRRRNRRAMKELYEKKLRHGYVANDIAAKIHFS